MKKTLTLIAHRKHVVIIALALILTAGAVYADCPASGEKESAYKIGVERGHILAFPIQFNEDPMTHRLELRVCLYDAATDKPLKGLEFDIVRYSGKPNHGGGPRISDLRFYRPTQDNTLPSELVRRGNAEGGEIFLEGLPKAQYALVPDWDSTEAEGISVNFWFEKVVVSEIPIERVAAF